MHVSLILLCDLLRISASGALYILCIYHQLSWIIWFMESINVAQSLQYLIHFKVSYWTLFSSCIARVLGFRYRRSEAASFVTGLTKMQLVLLLG